MAIGTPAALTPVTASGTNVATVSLALTIGDLLIVSAFWNSAATVTSFVWNGIALNLDSPIQTVGTAKHAVYSLYITAGATANLVLTLSGNTTIVVEPLKCTGLMSTSWTDKVANAVTATTTSPSSGATATLSQADELAIGAFARTGSSVGGSWSNSFTDLHTSNSGANGVNNTGYKVVAATTAVTAAKTGVTNAAYSAICVTYKGLSSGINGDSAITESADTVSGSGTLPIQAASSVSEAGDTVSSAAALALQATATPTDVADTVSATGALALQAASAITEAADTVSAAGTLALQSAASITESADTISAAGTLALAGAASITEAADSVASASALAIQAGAAITEAADTVSADGSSAAGGSVSITEASDSLASAGTLAIQGSAAITEGADTLSATSTGAPIVTFGPIGVTRVTSNAHARAVASTLNHQVISIATRRAVTAGLNHGVTSNAKNRSVLGVAA